MVTGSCLCGGIRCEISGKLEKIQICHCQQCRKAQGGPLASNIPVAVKDITFIKGEDLLQEYESQTRPGKHRVFCSRCGSPIFSRLDNAPQFIRVRAGLLNEPFSSEVAQHQFVSHKASWWTISDGLPQYDEYPTD